MDQSFQDSLLKWFDENKRDLPWRQDRSPYKVWLSEVILQQTRVNQGLPYYHRFIKNFPDIKSLAQADQQDVLKLWQGLGYYNRGRNLHHAAQQVMEDFGGYFPEKYQELKKLKGVGDYTASAIASFVYNEPLAVLDGNVKRVLSRLYNEKTPINSTEGERVFKELAEQTLDKNRPGKFNEAMMEFGALQCTPKPRCTICPLQGFCKAYQKGGQLELPVKLKKRERSYRYFNYFKVVKNGRVLLQKRTAKDIWQGLYQPPLIETQKEIKEGARLLDGSLSKPADIRYICTYRHTLTHRQLIARFFELYDLPEDIFNENCFWVNLNELTKYPVPKLIEKFFTTHF